MRDDERMREVRRRMVTRLRNLGYIKSDEVTRSMEAVPRHLFVPPSIRGEAYVDTPMQIGEGQTISAPHMVAIMAEAADLGPGMKVLEIGGGSGYNAAVIAELVKPGGTVYSVERIASLAEKARKSLEAAGYGEMVEMIIADGSRGVPEHAPFDRIVVTAAAPVVPAPLKEQLADGGELLIPVGSKWYQDLVRVRREGSRFREERLTGCVFVPLIGEYGFPG